MMYFIEVYLVCRNCLTNEWEPMFPSFLTMRGNGSIETPAAIANTKLFQIGKKNGGWSRRAWKMQGKEGVT